MTGQFVGTGRRCAGAAGLVWLALAAGCGAGTGNVSGKVTYNNGTPLPGGTICFFGPGGKVTRAKIQGNGTYAATDVPVGPVKVAVAPATPPRRRLGKSRSPFAKEGGAEEAAEESPSKKYVKVPKKYLNPDTSELKLTVVPGDQPFDVDVKGAGEQVQ
jgi:hypothetical protein